MNPHRLARWALPLALFIGAVGGGGVGVALRPAEEPAVPVVAPSAPAQVTHDPSVPVTSSASPTAASLSPVTVGDAPVTAFGEGGFYVSSGSVNGEITIKPGTYRSAGEAGAAATSQCSWRLADAQGIVDHDLTRDPVTVALRGGQFFRSQGCQSWSRVG